MLFLKLPTGGAGHKSSQVRLGTIFYCGSVWAQGREGHLSWKMTNELKCGLKLYVFWYHSKGLHNVLVSALPSLYP